MYKTWPKRFLDIFLGLFLMSIFLLPFIAICMVQFVLGTPVFYKQERVGLKGKVFTLYKFCSMRVADATNMPEQERISAFGAFLRKYSLDELPQFWNLLKGDISIVGPRPLLPEYLPLYTERQAKRHLVKPGITGLAQIKGRNALSWDAKFEFDIYYLEHLSFWFDVKIMVLTIPHLVFPKKDEHSIPEKFKGSKKI